MEPFSPNRIWKVKPVKWRSKKGGSKSPYQGSFYPGYPEKYQGDVDNIIFRSGMELRLFKYLDQTPGIVVWSSEETVIPYVSPKDGRVHRYFVDAKITKRKTDGTEQTYLIEVKPASQCGPPNRPKKPNKKNISRYLREDRVYQINAAKWQAAEALCKSRGWLFVKLTEKHLVF